MKKLVNLLRFIFLVSGIITLVLLFITMWSAQNLYLNLKENGFLYHYEIKSFISSLMMLSTSMFFCLVSVVICKKIQPKHFSDLYLFAIEDTVVKKYYKNDGNLLSVREVFIPKGMTVFFPNFDIYELPKTLRIDGVSKAESKESKRLFPNTVHIDQFFMGDWLPSVPSPVFENSIYE